LRGCLPPSIDGLTNGFSDDRSRKPQGCKLQRSADQEITDRIDIALPFAANVVQAHQTRPTEQTQKRQPQAAIQAEDLARQFAEDFAERQSPTDLFLPAAMAVGAVKLRLTI